MHAYSWVITDVIAASYVPSAEDMTAACLSMESILDDPRNERVGWYVIGGRWNQWLRPELAKSIPLPHDMQNEWWKDVPGNVSVAGQLDPNGVVRPSQIFTPHEHLDLMAHPYDIFNAPDPAKIPAARTLLTKYPNNIIMAIDIHD